jgi:UDP-glucose 4-epimerase
MSDPKSQILSPKSRIVVTGASGFIGTNLTKLLEDEFEVIPFEGDLLDKAQVVDFFEKNKNIDQIVHLVGLFGGSIAELMNVNVNALGNLIEEADRNNIRKITHTSTGAVYGEPKADESFESDTLTPNTYYGLSKKIAEDLLRLAKEIDGIDYCILRFPNVYGEGNPKGVVYNFLSSILEKGEVTIYGDGNQARNFLHVSDACAAIRLAMDYTGSGLWNISNPEVVTINELVEIFKEKYDFKVNYLPANNNLKDLILNVDKAKEELGFESKVKQVRIPELNKAELIPVDEFKSKELIR